jgi:hypothetical protein
MYGTPGLKYFAQATMYGSGADGAVVISADTTLTAHMQYTNLTIDSGKTLNTAGFTVQCNGTLTNNGTITDSTSGGTGGTSSIMRGGKGGGLVRIFAKTLTNNGTIHANGFDAGYEAVSGADGGAGGATTVPGAGNGGTGGSITAGANGGNAGTVLLTYDARTAGTVTATGGTAGTPFGTGSDGAVTISSNTTLTADKNYTNLTVNAGVTLNTAGFTVCVSGTLTNNGTVTDSTSGGAGGAGGATKTGVLGTGETGNAGSAGSVSSVTGGGTGGKGGGSGGSGGGELNGSSGVFVAGGNGGAGGTGGKGGGVFRLFVATIVNNGSINANGYAAANGSAGGAGENYDSAAASGGGGGGAGGQGGNGGKVTLYYGTGTVGTITAAVGGAGSGGAAGVITGTVTPQESFTITYLQGANGGSGGSGAAYGGTGGKGATINHSISFAEQATNGTVGANGTAGASAGTVVSAKAVNGSAGSDGAATWENVTYGAYSNSTFRGGIVVGTDLYLAIGANIVKISSTGVVTLLGTIGTTAGNVFMASNGTEILIVDSTTNGHLITIATGVIADITDSDFPDASSCTFMDGYFIVTKDVTGEIYISGLYDGTAWDPLDYATAEGAPDEALRVFSVNNTLWIFGTLTTEVFYNTGATDFPFARINGVLLDKGLGASASVVLIDSQFYLLSNDMEVLRTNGYQFEKISTIHIDKAIQDYSTISDAIGYEYKMDGHTFYVLTFPTADKTFVFDVSTGFWHEWSSYKTTGVATFGRHRGAIGFYCNRKYIVGDYANGKLYELDMDVHLDDIDLIKRTRRAQTISKDRKKIAFHSIDIEFETGVGLSGSGSGSDPQVGLTWSDDGGNTWATVQYRDLGASADYSVKQKWHRLGMAKNRIFELTMYEPVKFVLIGASAELEEMR